MQHDLLIYTNLLLALQSSRREDIQTPHYNDVENNESTIATYEVPRWNSSENPNIMVFMSTDSVKYISGYTRQNANGAPLSSE